MCVCVCLQGSGKTLAFGLPIMQLLVDRRQAAAGLAADTENTQGTNTQRPDALRALVLAPTRELAMQVSEHLTAIGQRIGVWVVPIVGGISQQKQERLLSKRPEVVVATPGRLWDLMKEGQPHVASLGSLEFLVIDEADRMVQQGHYSELSSILEAVSSAQRATRRSRGILDAGDDWGDVGDDYDDLEEEQLKKGFEGDTKQYKHNKRKGDSIIGLQTFVFSATLTLPTDMRRRLKKVRSKNHLLFVYIYWE